MRAHVAVQTGCDHRCTFCVIPYGRGNSRSVPAGEVVAQVRALVDQGVKEVVLTGVDLTSWGADLPGAPPLGRLVQRILKLVPDLARLRLSSIDAAEIDDALLDAFATSERLMPYPHLSLQHGDDLMLKRMKRPPPAGGRPGPGRARPRRAARHRLRRRPDRRLPDRGRGGVFQPAVAGRRGGPGLRPRLSLQPPPRHAGRADAPTAPPDDQGPRGRPAPGGRPRPGPASARPGRTHGPGAWSRTAARLARRIIRRSPSRARPAPWRDWS